jgi:HK97 family phage prohead protease
MRGIEERSSADSVAVLSEPSSGLTMVGHFARFNEWTEIDSALDGRFMERIAPGAFARTFKNERAGVRVLFNHGRDPSIGNKVLGPIVDLREDERGGYFQVPLLDTSYTRDLIPALEEGLYGSSFRFRVMRESIDAKPARSSYNPDALPERTLREVKLFELGPVTFPAYAGATAGLS